MKAKEQCTENKNKEEQQTLLCQLLSPGLGVSMFCTHIQHHPSSASSFVPSMCMVLCCLSSFRRSHWKATLSPCPSPYTYSPKPYCAPGLSIYNLLLASSCIVPLLAWMSSTGHPPFPKSVSCVLSSGLSMHSCLLNRRQLR